MADLNNQGYDVPDEGWGLTGKESFDEWLAKGQLAGYYDRGSNNTIYGGQGVRTPKSTAYLQASYNASMARAAKRGQLQQQAGVVPPGGKTDSVDAEIEAFYQKMMELRPDDPEVQQALAFGSNQAANEAKLRGIDGSIAVSEVARQGGQALNGLRQFRQGLAAQALGMKANRATGLAQLGEQARQFDYGAAQNAYGNRIGAGQAIGGAIGGIAGSYIGPIGTMAGSAIGAGVGGWVAGGGGNQNGGYPQPPSYGSYGNGGGGGGPSYGRGY